jgi:hypothetical protein
LMLLALAGAPPFFLSRDLAVKPKGRALLDCGHGASSLPFAQRRTL